MAQDGGDIQLVSLGFEAQGRVQRWRGLWEEAAVALKQSATLAQAIPDHMTHVEVLGELGQLYLQRGNLEQAWISLREGQRLYIEHNVVHAIFAAPLRNGLAEAHVLAAEYSKGTERAGWLRKAGPACRDALKHGKAFRGGLPEAMRLQGTCEWLRGKPAAAQKWWERSLSVAQEMGQPYDLGRTHLEMGQRLADQAHLERAEAIFADIGAEWDLRRARGALEKSRGALIAGGAVS